MYYDIIYFFDERYCSQPTIMYRYHSKTMGMKKVIKLVTPKGEEVLVNFNNVSYCSATNINHTSLRINHAHGKDNVGVYLVVVETIEEIQNKLCERLPPSVLNGDGKQ